MTVLTLRPHAIPRGDKFAPAIEYAIDGMRGSAVWPRLCADPVIAKSYAAIVCAAYIARLPVPRSFAVTVEN